jgi:hypothetical protein
MLNSALGDVDGNLQFQVPSMKKLDQTEPKYFQFCGVGIMFFSVLRLLTFANAVMDNLSLQHL